MLILPKTHIFAWTTIWNYEHSMEILALGTFQVSYVYANIISHVMHYFIDIFLLKSGKQPGYYIIYCYYLPLLCKLRKRRLCTEEKDTNTSVYSSII